MEKIYNFSALRQNPVLSALDPSACYLIQFALERENFRVELVYYDSVLELYCAICFLVSLPPKKAGEEYPPGRFNFGREGFERTAAWIDAMLDSFFTEHVPLAISGIPALDFDPELRSLLLRHLTNRCYKNGLPLVILP